jgi:hypothetical protein
MEPHSWREPFGVTVKVAHEIGSGILNCIYLIGEISTGLVVDETTGFFDAVLDGFFIATNEILSLALQIVK